MSVSTPNKVALSGFSVDVDHFPSLSSTRQKALEVFETVGLPNHKHEEYKYTPINGLAEIAWVQPSEGPTEVDLSTIALTSFDQVRIAFVDGVFRPDLSTNLDTDGIEFLRLEDAIASGASTGWLATLARVEGLTFEVAAHLGQLGKPELPPLSALNTASFTTGAFLRFKKAQVVSLPVHVLYLSTGGNVTSTPRLLVIAEEGSEVTLLESYGSLGSGASLTVPVTEIFVAPNAKLEHIRLGNENLEAKNVGLVEVRQEADSTYQSYNVVFGGSLVRNDINIFIDGSNAHTRFDGVIAISGDQHVDNHTRLDHAKPHCESFEIYKHLLSDRARAVFNGKIFVHQDAQKTDAKQTNKTLLLSPTAQIDTKPQLEIFADDVKCTHGATIGQLRSDALFYLKSRGIGEVKARALLVYAFAAEVMELISHDQVREELEQMLFQKLGTDKS